MAHEVSTLHNMRICLMAALTTSGSAYQSLHRTVAGLRTQVTELEAQVSECEHFKLKAWQHESLLRTEVCVTYFVMFALCKLCRLFPEQNCLVP
jgi:hypothetical protein